MSHTLKNKQLLKPLIGFALIIDMIIIDQLSKWFIIEHTLKQSINTDSAPLDLITWFQQSEKLGSASVEIFSFFNLSMVWNHGISFGMFQSDTPYFLIGVALIISVIFGSWLWKSNAWFQTIALSLIIGGALGNVIDRLHFGHTAFYP